jgi:putative flippase GtrA
MQEIRRLVGSLVRFGMLTVWSFGLSLGVTALLHEVLGCSAELAFAVALVTVFVTNFLACRYFVFPAAGADARRQLGLFTLFSALFRGAEYLLFLLVHTLIGVHYIVAIVGIKGAIVAAKFVSYRTWIFVPGPGEGRGGEESTRC